MLMVMVGTGERMDLAEEAHHPGGSSALVMHGLSWAFALRLIECHPQDQDLWSQPILMHYALR